MWGSMRGRKIFVTELWSLFNLFSFALICSEEGEWRNCSVYFTLTSQRDRGLSRGLILADHRPCIFYSPSLYLSLFIGHHLLSPSTSSWPCCLLTTRQRNRATCENQITIFKVLRMLLVWSRFGWGEWIGLLLSILQPQRSQEWSE